MKTPGSTAKHPNAKFMGMLRTKQRRGADAEKEQDSAKSSSKPERRTPNGRRIVLTDKHGRLIHVNKDGIASWVPPSGHPLFIASPNHRDKDGRVAFVASANAVDNRGQHVFVGPQRYTGSDGRTYSFVAPTVAHGPKRARLFVAHPNFASLYGQIVVLPYNRITKAAMPLASGVRGSSVPAFPTTPPVPVQVSVSQTSSMETNVPKNRKWAWIFISLAGALLWYEATALAITFLLITTTFHSITAHTIWLATQETGVHLLAGAGIWAVLAWLSGKRNAFIVAVAATSLLSVPSMLTGWVFFLFATVSVFLLFKACARTDNAQRAVATVTGALAIFLFGGFLKPQFLTPFYFPQVYSSKYLWTGTIVLALLVTVAIWLRGRHAVSAK